MTDASGAPPSLDSSMSTRTSFASLSLRSGNGSLSASTSGASPHNSHGILPDGTSLADLLPETMIRRWSLSDFRIGERVGASRLSAVYRAQHKSTGLELALKCYLRNKLDPFSLTQIKREIQIHSKVAHRNIMPFYGSFEDERGNVYLLHQFMRRGDVFNALSSAGGVFSEEKTCAEIIQPVASAVAYLHTNGIMHRDIKPENLLLGEVGAGCQLTDFGFAVDYRRNRCVTRLGTTDYMAPEIVRCDKARRDKLRAMDRSGYGPEVDCWAIGILAFECLVGCAPFESNSTEETYRRILADEPEFPEHASPEARDFIRRCLEKDPNRRLGALQMLSHPWVVAHVSGGRREEAGSAAVTGARRGSYSLAPANALFGSGKNTTQLRGVPEGEVHTEEGGGGEGTSASGSRPFESDSERLLRLGASRSATAPAGKFPEVRLEDGDGDGGEAEEGRKMDEEMVDAERFPEVLAADEVARPGPGSGAPSLRKEPSDRLRSKSLGGLGTTLQRGWGKLRAFVYRGASASSRGSGASLGGFDSYVDPETREGEETREAPRDES